MGRRLPERAARDVRVSPLLDLRKRYAISPLLFSGARSLGIKPLYYAQTADGWHFHPKCGRCWRGRGPKHVSQTR